MEVHAPTGAAGYFALTLDTELGWGFGDDAPARARWLSADGSRERAAIRRIAALCAAYRVPATWALAGGLLNVGDDPLWSAPDVVDLLRARTSPLLAHGASPDMTHEIACHGYTHTPWDRLSPSDARAEIDRWQARAAAFGVAARVMVFPRNRVAHLDMLAAAGFVAYRGPDMPPLARRVPLLGRWLARFPALNAVLAMPPVYALTGLRPGPHGLLNLPPSQYLFAGTWRSILPGLHRALHRAAQRGGLVHVWGHPWEFRHAHDFAALESLLARVRAAGLCPTTLGALATRLRADAAPA